jgi:hypothetical protein
MLRRVAACALTSCCWWIDRFDVHEVVATIQHSNDGSDSLELHATVAWIPTSSLRSWFLLWFVDYHSRLHHHDDSF